MQILRYPIIQREFYFLLEIIFGEKRVFILFHDKLFRLENVTDVILLPANTDNSHA